MLNIENEEEVVTSLERLQEIRSEYVTIARKNKFEAGLRTLLADLYPDNAHFIYELLQNAEDAGASTVEFELRRDQLVVLHDGKRAFTLKNIEAITGIGQSPKKDDETQIGKFGVGFKAVFAYTEHPEIYSGEFAFVINDLFVPKVLRGEAPDDQTMFVFPFDNPNKAPSAAYEEIAAGLRALSSSTVLFLTRIHTVSYTLADGGAGSVSRIEETHPKITITQTTDTTLERTSWLRIIGEPKGAGAHMNVAAAFKLGNAGAEDDKSKGLKRAGVQPLDAGETCIYFPATKETSGLRFHIHAPFASTVARDSVRDTPDNAQLVNEIGQLIVDALPKLRDDGFLDDGLLEALPNASDALTAPYDVIRTLIYDAFQNQPLTPVFGGGKFAPAKQLYSSPQEFRRGLTQEDLSPLLALSGAHSGANPRWAKSSDGRAGQFLKGLAVTEFEWADLQEAIEFVAMDLADSNYKGEKLIAWIAWLNSKTDDQIKKFYELLGVGSINGSIYELDVPLIRINDGATVDHVRGQQAFLPEDRHDTGPNRVLAALINFDGETSKDTKSSSALAAFYSAAGVHKWDDKAIVMQRLAVYGDRFPEWKEHLNDVRVFMEYFQAHPNGLAIFQNAKFLLAENSSGKQSPVQTRAICIDSPYETTGLAALNANRLSAKYHQEVDGIAQFAKSLGARSGLSLEPISVTHQNKKYDPAWRNAGRWTTGGISRDWDLPMLDVILVQRDTALLKSLWKLVCNEKVGRAQAQYQLNASARLYRFESQIAQRLRRAAWVLDRNGDLRTAQSMTVADLPDHWPSPAPDSLAVAVGFGEDAQTRSFEHIERRKSAESLGITLEMAEILAQLDEPSQRETFEYARSLKQRSEFPNSEPADPQRRAAIVGADALLAPERKAELRERSVTTGASAETKKKAKQYLRELYAAGEAMVCQACQAQMPFRLPDGWYFEAVEFLPGRLQLHHQNYLALCPLCAAKYKHVRGTPDDALAECAKNPKFAGQRGTSVTILLNSAPATLMFSSKHALDLHTVLTVAGGARNSS